MGLKRIVDMGFWTDNKVEDFSPEDKYFMLYLLTNPASTLLGIYEFSIKKAAYYLGYSQDTVKVLLDRFQNKYHIILYSDETNEIAIKNYLRYSIVSGGKPVSDCIFRDMAKVKNKSLIDAVFKYISQKDDLNKTIKNIVSEHEYGDCNGNGYGNGNGNGYGYWYGVSYHESYHESSDSSKIKGLKDSNESYHESSNESYNESSKENQQNCKVPMTDIEYNALIRKYGKSFVDTRIERSKKYPGSSNYQTVKKWCEEDYKKNKASVDKYNSFPQNQYDFEALEKEFVSNQPNDPEFERRMDELQSRLREKYRKDK